MNATFSIPPDQLRRFQDTLKRRAAVGRMDAKDIVNARALDVAFKSLKNTKMADRGNIERTLGVTSYKVSKSRKTGQYKKRGINVEETSFAARIVNAKHKAAGEPLVFGDQLLKESKALINARLRAVTFVKAGWIPAIRKLSSASKDSSIKNQSKGEARAFGQPKGSAIAAKGDTSYPSATITNFANKGSQRAAGFAQAGLVAGVEESIADMEVYIKRKVAESNAKVFT